MRLRHLFLALTAGWWLSCNAVAATNTFSTELRPLTWAQPLPLPGLTNSFRVTTNLYRGSQPSAEGMRALQALGIRSVINLRAFHSDKDELQGTTLKGFRFETKPWHAELEDVLGFLKIVSDTNNLPVYVHCQRGADRTGTMCAMYRIVICGWSKDDALAELQQGGFHFAPVWKNLVKFIKEADIPKIKEALAKPPTPPKP